MEPAVEHLLRERRGVVLRRELRALGISDRQLRQQVREGIWTASGRSVLIHSSAPPGLRTDTLVAGLRNPDAILTGASAALFRPSAAWPESSLRHGRASIIAPPHRRGPWLTVQHPGAMHDVIGGFRVADPLTMLIDLLRHLPWSDAAAIGGAATRLGLYERSLLESASRGLERTPRYRQLSRLVSAMLEGAESGPEIDLQWALRKASIKGWEANPTITIRGRQYRPDIAFRAERIALEYDGLEEHSSAVAFRRDRQRDIDFQFADWMVLRLTAATLYDPSALAGFLADLQQARLRRRGRKAS